MPRTPAHHRSAWTKSDDRKLFAMHSHGAPAAEIARTLGRTRPSIYQRLTTQRPRRRRSSR